MRQALSGLTEEQQQCWRCVCASLEETAALMGKNPNAIKAPGSALAALRRDWRTISHGDDYDGRFEPSNEERLLARWKFA
jgi:hypothetical protein